MTIAEQKVDELIASINNLADVIRESFPTASPNYPFEPDKGDYVPGEDLAEVEDDMFKAAMKQLLQVSGRDTVKNILGAYGARNLSDLRKEDRKPCYDALVAAAQEQA